MNFYGKILTILFAGASALLYAADLTCADRDSLGKSADEELHTRIGFAPHAGFIIPHTAQMKHLIQGHSFGGHLQLMRPVSGKASWHKAYNYPEHSLDLTWINTGNMRQFGQQFSASYMLHLPLRRKVRSNELLAQKPAGHFFSHYLGLGLGTGYASRIWDLESNHQSAVIGSHLNVAISLQYALRLFQRKGMEMRFGLRITHFSNGAFRVPNLGTNNAGIFVQSIFGKASRRMPPIGDANSFMPLRKTWHLYLALSGGAKEVPPPTHVKHIVGTLSALVERRITVKSSLGIGADLFYNSSLHVLLQRKWDSDQVVPADIWQSGVLLSYGLHFGEFSVRIQQGFYLRDKWKNDGLLYHRFAVRYRLNDFLSAQLALKTHYAKADFGELGISWDILAKKNKGS